MMMVRKSAELEIKSKVFLSDDHMANDQQQ